MRDNYEAIVKDNLQRFYQDLTDERTECLPGVREGDIVRFDAFGGRCAITPEAILLEDKPVTSIMGILISLYALHAGPGPCQLTPMRAFKEFPDSMPYVGAFATHTEQVLVPYVGRLEQAQQTILEALNGNAMPEDVGGDFSFLVYPLPKIALGYIFYRSDEDFPPSATCLYSSNALDFIPIDGLADVGEYTSKLMIELID